MSLEQINNLLRSRIGLEPASLGSKSIAANVSARQRALQLPDLAHYVEVLTQSSDELDALVDELVVPETWFFRGGEVFAYLAQHIRAVMESRSAGQPFRILSIPCSTGEEPYSMAIALNEAGVPSTQWRIDAVDISRRHLERAQRGCFSDFAFRQTDPSLRARYFQQINAGWEIRSALRSVVHFRHGNLIEAGFLSNDRPYDLIFCRNLLIYLHEAARRQTMTTLDRLLAPDGLICAGHAEPLSSLDSRYCRVGPDSYFLFSRTATIESKQPPQVRRPVRTAVAPRVQAPSPPSNTRPRPIPKPHATAGAHTAASSTDLLAAAKIYANAGQLDQAITCCQNHLVATGPSADLYALWGTIHQAQGSDIEARHCFDKALYLEPDHHEALLHLMLLCQRDGVNAQATVLRARLERSAPRGDA